MAEDLAEDLAEHGADRTDAIDGTEPGRRHFVWRERMYRNLGWRWSGRLVV